MEPFTIDVQAMRRWPGGLNVSSAWETVAACKWPRWNGWASNTSFMGTNDPQNARLVALACLMRIEIFGLFFFSFFSGLGDIYWDFGWGFSMENQW